MLCFVLVLSLTSVGARELKFLTALDDKAAIAALTTKDPWSSIVGDTEGAPSITLRLRSWSSPLRPGLASTSSSGRRANNLVESLRRQLMRDNYDYINKDSADNSSTTTPRTVSTTTSPPTTASKTTTTKTTKVTTLKEEATNTLEKKIVSSHYFNSVLTTLIAGDFSTRAHSKPGLHLRRNIDLSNEVNQAQDREDLSAQAGQDMTSILDTSQQMTFSQQLRRNHKRDVIYKRLRGNVRHSYRKTKHRQKIKPRPVDGIKRRAKLYGLRPKQYGPSRHIKRGIHKKHSRHHRHHYNQNSRRYDRIAYKREHAYDTPIKERHNNKINYRRNSHMADENNGKQEDETDSQKGNNYSKKSNRHVTQYDKQYDDQETNVQINGNNDKKQSNSNKDENNLHETKVTQDINDDNINNINDKRDLNEDKQAMNEDNVDAVHEI